jgi:hypothetical protein
MKKMGQTNDKKKVGQDSNQFSHHMHSVKKISIQNMGVHISLKSQFSEISAYLYYTKCCVSELYVGN